MFSRRHLIASASLAWLMKPLKTGATTTPPDPSALQRALQKLEADSGGRLGVHLQDTGSGAAHSHRADERFLMCSTVKLLVSAKALQRVDRGEEMLGRRIAFTTADLVPHSPATAPHAGGAGLSVEALCRATMTQSDNAACNLLMASYGGPAQVTAFARELGDAVTRVDDFEPAVNRLRPGDPANTTSPRAMAGNLQQLLFGEALKPASRALLQGWLRNNLTGARKLRAGLPPAWKVGDKTGGGDQTSNDVAVIWPPGRAPWLLAVYLTDCPAPPDARDRTIAQVGRLAAGVIAAGRRA